LTEADISSVAPATDWTFAPAWLEETLTLSDSRDVASATSLSISLVSRIRTDDSATVALVVFSGEVALREPVEHAERLVHRSRQRVERGVHPGGDVAVRARESRRIRPRLQVTRPGGLGQAGHLPHQECDAVPRVVHADGQDVLGGAGLEREVQVARPRRSAAPATSRR
jgi:hypothetical protein